MSKHVEGNKPVPVESHMETGYPRCKYVGRMDHLMYVYHMLQHVTSQYPLVVDHNQNQLWKIDENGPFADY